MKNSTEYCYEISLKHLQNVYVTQIYESSLRKSLKEKSSNFALVFRVTILLNYESHRDWQVLLYKSPDQPQKISGHELKPMEGEHAL